MTCKSCQESTESRAAARAQDAALPLLASDLQVVAAGEVRPFEASDWPADKHKLLIFYPEVFTPVCGSELGALNEWLSRFAELDCVVIAATSDPPEAVADWYRREELLNGLACLTFSSYLLPARLALVDRGRAKRASVFVTKDNEIVKQEHFSKVGRSLADLHRQLWAYTQGTYCGEGWTNPADNLST